MREPEPTKAVHAAKSRVSIRNTSATTTTGTPSWPHMPETEAMNRILYREWFPQIVYNRHQTRTGGHGFVLRALPRSPELQLRPPHSWESRWWVTPCTGALSAEGKPGATMRSGASYSTWWNGCVRCTPYFHNMIGILTEIIGNPTPMKIPFRPADATCLETTIPYPIAPQDWHFRQSIDYIMTADRAIIDVASKNREDFLFNIYLMGRNSIERGSRDHWTLHPKAIAVVEAAIEEGRRRDDRHRPLYRLSDRVLRDASRPGQIAIREGTFCPRTSRTF